ncbi:MAG: hypothetical protein U0326_31425 [Polyangiales bacterium]
MKAHSLALSLALASVIGCGGADPPGGGSGTYVVGDDVSPGDDAPLDSGMMAMPPDALVADDASREDAPLQDASVDDRPREMMPDVVAPDVVLPDVVLPDVVLPDVVTRDVLVPDVVAPDVALPDAVAPDVVVPDVVVRDVVAPDVVVPVDVAVDRPDAAVLDVAVDRPDVTVVDVPVDRPDTTVVDVVVDVPVDRPDTTVIDAAVDVPVDRPDTTVVDAVVDVPVDRPDTTVVDVVADVAVDRPDATVIDVVADVAVDRPDTTVADVAVDVAVDRPDATLDAGVDATVDVAPDASTTIPPDPVAYVGTFSTRTDGRSFLLPMRVLGSRRDVWIQMPVTLGPNPALMLAFHGTNGDGAVMLSDSGASTVIASNNVIFIAPTSRWFGGEGADFDHPGGNGTYWETANNPNPDTNEDLVLVRAIIQEARRAYNIDPARVYAYGHSNGGFMAYMVAQVLCERVVGFGENSAGLSRCNPQQSCRFQGAGTTCAALSTQSGWCTCAGPELPVPVPTTGRHGPAILLHGTADPLVSVYHTCTLEALLRARGHTVSTTLFDGGGHYLSATVASRVWSFLSPYRMP